MKRLGQVALTAVVVALATARMFAVDPTLASPNPELDPQEVFQSAIDRLKGLEAKYAALKGVSQVNPHLRLDDNQRLKSGDFVFEENALPPGKARPRRKTKQSPLFMSPCRSGRVTRNSPQQT